MFVCSSWVMASIDVDPNLVMYSLCLGWASESQMDVKTGWRHHSPWPCPSTAEAQARGQAWGPAIAQKAQQMLKSTPFVARAPAFGLQRWTASHLLNFAKDLEDQFHARAVKIFGNLKTGLALAPRRMAQPMARQSLCAVCWSNHGIFHFSLGMIRPSN